jgi:hypothetical protein
LPGSPLPPVTTAVDCASGGHPKGERMNRWDAFTERERALVAVAFSALVILEGGSGNPDPGAIAEAAELLSEINLSIGADPVDPDLIRAMRLRAEKP